VTRQLVAPVTATHGHASWALMLHPDGLPCDLFVTHCWQEGTFEFVDKVLHSWPKRTTNAYCCMLSNPQTLNIGEMLVDPLSSPFAQALRSATCVLVVPNSRCSVYTRIWCVYEAFLAYSLNTPIFTATKPVRGLRMHIGCMLVRYIAFGWLSLALIRFVFPDVDASAGTILVVIPAYTLSALFNSSLALAITNEAGAVLSAVLYSNLVRVYYLERNIPLFAYYLTVLVTFAAFFALREVDRLWAREHKREAAELQQDYTGRLQDAVASVPQDREHILAAIQTQNQEADVERAIDVLINAGMSTPALRSAAALGVDVSGAGCWNSGFVFGTVVFLVITPWLHLVTESVTPFWTFWCSVLTTEGIIWAVLFSYLGVDQRGFAASSATLLGFLPHGLTWAVAFLAGAERPGGISDLASAIVWGPLVITFSRMGVAGCAALPWPGVHIARLIMCPIRRSHDRPRWRRWASSVSRAAQSSEAAEMSDDSSGGSGSDPESSDPA